MYFYGQEIQFLHDVGIFDLARFLDRLPFQPFRGEARTGDGGSTAEGFELLERSLYMTAQV